MKKIIGILAALMMCFTLSSCVTTAQAQVDGVYDDVDVSVVVSYGTPYYNAEGLLLYYIYRDMYYYPYYYHNRYYLHRYSRPLPPRHLDRYRPVPRDAFHHNHGHRPNPRHNSHRPNIRHDNHRPNMDIRPNVNRPTQRPNVGQPRTTPNINRGGSRPNMGGNRSMAQPRTSTRATVGGGSHGHVGGRR